MLFFIPFYPLTSFIFNDNLAVLMYAAKAFTGNVTPLPSVKSDQEVPCPVPTR